ncbi:hypothetical protein [Nostoc linckia]|nr:hypothetical protein [Nostoc linckia]
MDRYCTSVEALVHPIHDLHKRSLLKGDMQSAEFFEAARNAIQQKLFSERIRSQDIIHWLKLDTELRQMGEQTYPDVMERYLNKIEVFDESY